MSKTRIEFETFRYSPCDQMRKETPDCFNGRVEVKKFRVIIEPIDEPKEVVFERIKKLWRECDNMHHFGPLRKAAEELGFTLDSRELGTERKRS